MNSVPDGVPSDARVAGKCPSLFLPPKADSGLLQRVSQARETGSEWVCGRERASTQLGAGVYVA